MFKFWDNRSYLPQHVVRDGDYEFAQKTDPNAAPDLDDFPDFFRHAGNEERRTIFMITFRAAIHIVLLLVLALKAIDLL